MNAISMELERSWAKLLASELETVNFSQIKTFIANERSIENVFPPDELIFAAFAHTPVEKVKVVIIGQDPYHGQGQANGLCFSVGDGMRQPPSLGNIFKELENDVGIKPPLSGNLEKWADNGVLLLNAALTVRASSPLSHQKCGWQQFTDATISKLSTERSGIVFLLWGNFAQQKEMLIDNQKGHLILKAAHPSPLSARKGFFGCKHFSQVNTFLSTNGSLEIDWSL